MNFSGGYNVPLAGRPAGEAESPPEPQVLYLPLRSRRFTFSAVCAEEGEQVEPGRVLARDPERHNVPLIAPRRGKVRLEAVPQHLVLEEVSRAPQERLEPEQAGQHIPWEGGAANLKRFKLLVLGAWQFFSDARSGEVPDPLGVPSAVIVSALNLDPYTVRGDVQLRDGLEQFTRGLEQLQSLLEYQPIYLVVPRVESDLAREVEETLRGYAWVKQIQVPLRYPFGSPALWARRLGLGTEGQPVWALRTEGVLAVDRALTRSLPCTDRVLSVGGPKAENPRHLTAVPGYPLEDLLGKAPSEPALRIVSGGVLTGRELSDAARGVDVECSGLTVLEEHRGREFLGFLRPGWDRTSYAGTFLGNLRPRFRPRSGTALWGEGRPCVSCGFCEEVCPARIMPHQIHKCLYHDALEEVEKLRVDLCMECGLCSYVCPSKIELRRQMAEAKQQVRRELHPEESAV